MNKNHFETKSNASLSFQFSKQDLNNQHSLMVYKLFKPIAFSHGNESFIIVGESAFFLSSRNRLLFLFVPGEENAMHTKKRYAAVSSRGLFFARNETRDTFLGEEEKIILAEARTLKAATRIKAHQVL